MTPLVESLCVMDPVVVVVCMTRPVYVRSNNYYIGYFRFALNILFVDCNVLGIRKIDDT